MIFSSPSWLSYTSRDIVGSGTVGDFVLGGVKGADSGPAADTPLLVAAHDGTQTRTARQLSEDVEALATGLCHDLGWSVNDSSQADKVIAVLSENTLDYLTSCWAIHRLGAVCLLLHGSTSPEENAKHLKHSGCTTLISSPALIAAGTKALSLAGASGARIYSSEQVSPDSSTTTNGTNGTTSSIKTVDELKANGTSHGSLPVQNRPAEQIRNGVAFLCPTSGTSGYQKLARLTHGAIITNIEQAMALEGVSRQREVDIVLGVVPLSHVQGVVASHTSIYARDRFIMHKSFDMKAALASVQGHRINRLYLVPPVLAALIGNPFLFKAFDLSSVDTVYVGAGGVSAELHAKLKASQPTWRFVTGYGLTESPAAVAMSSPHEYLQGSVGILLPGYQARLIREDGSEVEAFDEAGELLLSSPNQAQGYLGDDEATASTFRDGWLYTGDVAMFRQSPKGDAHLCIVDRLKDMIKVKGLQVSPVAIEECLKQYPGIADVAVIGVSDDVAGERPKAFVVLPPKQPGHEAAAQDMDELFDKWDDFVESKLTEPHWIRGRYEVIDALPRNPSGKVSKGVLRQRK